MSEKLPRINGDDLIRALQRAGFKKQRQKGSHVHLRRDADKKRLTVPVHRGRILPTGTLRAILRDADISIDDFRKLLE